MLFEKITGKDIESFAYAFGALGNSSQSVSRALYDSSRGNQFKECSCF